MMAKRLTLPVPGPPQRYINPGLGDVIPSTVMPVVIDFIINSLMSSSIDKTTDAEDDFES